MSNLLVADIGGTGSRLALMGANGPVSTPAIYRNSDFDSFAAILGDFLPQLAQQPACASLSVAGPVADNRVTMTNLGWTLDGAALASQFGFDAVHIINDFAALAWSTLDLTMDDLVQIGGGEGVALGNRGILGPGTGLGVSGLVHTGQDWAVIAGEGGHVTLPASTAEEAQVIAQISREHGHCSAERLVSGPGLVALYEVNGGASCAPEAVTRLAREGDALALQTVELFSQLLGTVAADLALTLGARGGIYLGGGILPDIASLFAASGFRQRFEAKGRFAKYLVDIPTYVICAPQPSFRGLYAYTQTYAL